MIIHFLSCSITGFDAIGDTKITSDASWGCMLRSSQMLVAQVYFRFILFFSGERSNSH